MVHLLTLWRGLFLGPSRDEKAAVIERRQRIARLAETPDAEALIDWIESFHAHDYLALRTAKGEDVARIQGQAARTDEILRVLLGADRLSQRSRRNG